MNSILIRPVVREDIKYVADIENLCFPKAEGASLKSFYERFDAFPESFFVAEIDNKIVGYINGCITDKPSLPDELYHDASLHNPSGDYQTVFGLAVVPDYQHEGIAGKLMNYLINISRDRGKKGIILTCKEHLIHFYEGFGYVHKGIADSTHGNAVWNNMLLEF